MTGINKVFFVGHIGKAPDFRRLGSAVAVLTFPLVTSETVTKNGVKTELTEWHNIVMWRSIAESAAYSLKKGELVYVEGKIRTRNFEDKSGIKKYVTEVIADCFKSFGKRSDPDNDTIKADTNYLAAVPAKII